MQRNLLAKAKTIAVVILVKNWPDNIEVEVIWVSVGRMSSRHSSRREGGMGSKVQGVGLDYFMIVLLEKGVTSCK